MILALFSLHSSVNDRRDSVSIATDRFRMTNHNTAHHSRNDANIRAINQTLNMAILPNQCECSIPDGGYCNRHHIEKTAHFVLLCHTRPEYFQAWELGIGPRQRAPIAEVPVAIRKPRPGAELQKIIAWWQKRFPWFDLSEKPGCNCGSVRAWMDSIGPDGCEKKIEQILDKLQAEAKKRKLTIPFQRTWARMMVKSAIRRARKNTR